MEEKYKKIIEKLNNETIKYACYTESSDDRFSAPRGYFVIEEPPELKEVFKWKGEEIKGLVPYLIKAMESPEKDFAAHVMLYVITRYPVIGEERYFTPKEWRDSLKGGEYLGWRIWWEKYKDRIAWDEKCKRLKPLLPEIWVEKARKERRNWREVMKEEIANFEQEMLEQRLVEVLKKRKVTGFDVKCEEFYIVEYYTLRVEGRFKERRFKSEIRMREKYQKVIEKLNNNTIKYICYAESPSDSSLMPTRYFVIEGPPELKEVFKWKIEEIKGLVPYLIKAMESFDKDFAAHIMLYAMTKYPALGGMQWLTAREWKESMKAGEYVQWRLWWEKYRDQVSWEEKWKRLKPILIEIWSEKARKEGKDFSDIVKEEMTNFIKEKKLPFKLMEDKPK